MTALNVAHGRECKAHTIVMQEHAQITPVSDFAQRLKEAREAAGYKSQAALARAAGLSPGTVGNWEAGTRQQPRDLLGLARVLGVSPEWLSTGADAAPLSDAGARLKAAPASHPYEASSISLDWRTAAIMLARQCKDADQRVLLMEFVREVDQVVAESGENTPIRAKLMTP